MVATVVCCTSLATLRQSPGRSSGNYRSSSAALAKLVLCMSESGEALSPEPAKLEVSLARPPLGLGTRRNPGSKGGGRQLNSFVFVEASTTEPGSVVVERVSQRVHGL